MEKAIKDMSLDELWKLFPIVLKEHNPQWQKWADDEIASLSSLLAAYCPVIHHIGSTAIPVIYAKPIVDILVELPKSVNRETVKNTMEDNGYICMSESDRRLSFNKGYTPRGYAEKVFHIHINQLGDNDEVFFRDYLNANPEIAKEYETLKIKLLSLYKNDRDAYTEAKSEFVKHINSLRYLF